jgi:hypothetical protein
MFEVGDLVLACKPRVDDGPHWEWSAGLHRPMEYGIITDVTEVTDTRSRYWITFIDGTCDCLPWDEIKLSAKCEKKSREALDGKE